MKRHNSILSVWLITLTLFVLGLTSLSMMSASDQASPLSTSLAASGTSYLLVDDFNTGSSRPCFAGNEGLVSSPCPIIDQSYVAMSYDVTIGGAYVWLPNDLRGVDLSIWDSVWVGIRGENGGEEVLAEFADCNETVFPKVKISEYLSGPITTDWRAVVISLNAFSEITDWSCVGRFSVVANSDVSSGRGTVQVDEIRLLPAAVLVDDFHDQEFKNELGGSSGPWSSDNTVVITPTFHNGTLKLSYSVPPGDHGGGYWTKLISTNLLSKRDYLLFDVHGEQGGEEFSAEFKDCGINGYTHFVEIKISDYLGGRITKNWHTVAIPLAAFVTVQDDFDEGVDWNCIDQLSFNVSGRSQYNSGQGTVYIDNVRLTSAGQHRSPLLVDNFQDCNDRNALNWGWYTGTTGAAEFTAIPDSDPANYLGDYKCGYRFTYNVEVGESGWAWTELKGLDVTDYVYLQFYVRGKQDDEITQATRVYLVDRSGNKLIIPIEATDNWQRVWIPLRDFELYGVDLTDLSELKFAFEEGVRVGEMYVDNISFVQPFSVSLPIILKPHLTELYIWNNNTGGNLTFVVRDLATKEQTVSCVVPNNTTHLCGSFPPGTYEVQAFTLCGGANPNPIAIKMYNSGPQTTEVYCN